MQNFIEDNDGQETEMGLKEIQISMDAARKSIALGDALRRLTDNKDFDLVIAEGYFKDEAARVVGAKADPAMLMNEVATKMLEDQIVSIGGLRQYFIKLQHAEQSSKIAMSDYRETQAELLKEQVGAA